MDNDALARLAILTANMGTPQTDVKHFAGCLYGPSGSGKTHSALEIAETITPAGKAIFHVDTSDNKDIREYVSLTHPYAYLPFTTIEDLRILTEAMSEGIGPYAAVGTVILDEASSMAADDLDRFHEARVKAIDEGKIKMPKDGRPDTPDWADFRPALTRFRSMLTNLYKVPGLNVILVAHERVDVKLNNMTVPDFSPELRKKVKAPLHLLVHYTADVATPAGAEEAVYTRMVQIHPSRSVDAKSRLGIPNVKFGTEYLPAAIKGWMDRGAIEHPEAPQVVESVAAPNLEDESTPDADAVDEITTDEFDFSPIN